MGTYDPVVYLPYDSPEKEGNSLALACCILRAKAASETTDLGPENHVYWHTREACYPVSRRLGLLWTWVMRHMKVATSFPDSKILELSSPFWTEVVHPDVLAREVMES